MGLEPTHFQMEQSTLDHSLKTSMFDMEELCSLFYYFSFHKLWSPKKIHTAWEQVSFATSETCTWYLRLLIPVVLTYKVSQKSVVHSLPEVSTHFLSPDLWAQPEFRETEQFSPLSELLFQAVCLQLRAEIQCWFARIICKVCVYLIWGKVQISEKWENVEVYFHHSG